jgi:Cof subfamily protein (haloacid dehalogenase superfamily)
VCAFIGFLLCALLCCGNALLKFAAERLICLAVKFIACDLDGTLLGADHVTVDERTKTALLKAHENGVKIAIATGRTLPVIYGTVNQIPFIDYVIYSNGAAVCDLKSAKTVYSKYMPADIAIGIIEFLLKYPVFFEVYSDAGQYSQAGCEKYFTNMNLPRDFLESYMKSITRTEDIVAVAKQGKVEKINLFYFEKEHYEEIKNFLFSYKNVECTSPVAGDIEITYEGVDKAYALEGVCRKLGIDACDVMAFGDADNDLKMLSYAGYGVAMGNADEKCKAAANYTTKRNDEYGVALFVERYALGIKPRLAVSACLLGENCKYNGGNNKNDAVIALEKDFKIVPVCPECFGGLKIPRVPNEIVSGRAISKNGEDFTEEYIKGAEKALYVAEESGACFAVLKERSPSCGKGMIYDGSFSGTLVPGNGITAELFMKTGISVFGESEIDKLLAQADPV